MRQAPDHGTYTRATLHRCSCKTCQSYRIRRAYDRASGRTGRVDSTQTRVHLEQLLARGWSQDQIAAAAGINQATVSIILSRQYTGVQRRTAAAILNVRLDQTPPIPRGFVGVTGTRRRLQALAVLGYSVPEIAREIGVSTSSLREATEGHSLMVRSGTAAKVAGIYRKLSVRPAPQTRVAEQARNEAMERGWHGPLAWADIEDPACEPEPCEVTAPQHVHPDDVAELAARGLDDHEIALRLRVSARTVLRARTAHNIPAGATA